MKIKLFIISTVWVLTGVFTSGCIVIDLNGCSAMSVKGSGNVISESRQLPEFSEIRLEGQGKVSLAQGGQSSLEVTTDDNILPSIKTEVNNGKLIISHEKGRNLRPTTLNFTITVKNLAGISIAGSGDIIGNDEFDSARFYADIAGSGDIAININADRLESSISGSGSISLSGSTNSYDTRITGSGDVDAFEMRAKDASVVITGSGNCRISASDMLRAKITGSGDVLYIGHPRISETITGSGKVKDRN
ncbi:hypothetical protein JY97_11840 [Alkalispirochaeta odontotermitis]|nr:hypothetical protein JY97_11840 [Alkalispirochaeta odontotermitis]